MTERKHYVMLFEQFWCDDPIDSTRGSCQVAGGPLNPAVEMAVHHTDPALAPHGQAVTAYRLDMPWSAFTEIADRVYVARYPQWDVNVGLVVGTAGALVIDTRSSAAAGAAVLRDVAAVAGPVSVRQVVNTHVHFDHTFGNVAFVGATIHAHDNAAAALDAHAGWIKAAARADPGDDPDHGYLAADIADLLATAVRKPDATFTTSAVVDLGDRVALLRYAGRGHTDGDAAVLVPDCAVAFLGDLIEQSGPPSFGPDSWPLEWADTLEEHLMILAADVVLVPGHGTAVDRDYAHGQRAQIEFVASVIRERRTAGMSLATALREPDARLPYPLEGLADAFVRGWEQLDGPTPRGGD